MPAFPLLFQSGTPALPENSKKVGWDHENENKLLETDRQSVMEARTQIDSECHLKILPGHGHALRALFPA